MPAESREHKGLKRQRKSVDHCRPECESALLDEVTIAMVMSDDYGHDLGSHVQDFIFLKKCVMSKLCAESLLSPNDTVDVFENGRSFKVLEPQWYQSITTLDSDHFMFTEDHDDSIGGICRGCFYECEGNAVSGSGSDVWYKVTPQLHAFCTTFHEEVCALVDAFP